MGKLRNLAAILLIASLAATSLIMVESVSASLIPKPSVPEFKVYLVNHPYDVAPVSPVYTTDPYNGEQKLVTSGSAGYHVDNVSIELWILNQQPSYSDGTNTFIPYYDVRTKGHFEQNWTDLGGFSQHRYMSGSNLTRAYIEDCEPVQTGYTYTVLTFSSTNSPLSVTYPLNATVDFQVSVVVGHIAPLFFMDLFDSCLPIEGRGTVLDAQSDWSEIQSITLTQPLADNSILASALQNPAKQKATLIPVSTCAPDSTATPTQTSTESTQPATIAQTGIILGLSWEQATFGLMAIIIVVLAAALVFSNRRKLKGAT